MYNKEGRINLETSAHYKNKLDTGITYYSTDVGTADLVFLVTRGGYPLLVSEENADVFLILKQNDSYLVDTVLPVDPMNGILKYTIPNEFLGLTGQITGQLYIAVHGKEDIVTEVEFSFTIKDSVINTIPATDKINEIRTFQEFRENIMQAINKINEALENGNDYVTQLDAAKVSGLKAINDRNTEVLSQITNLSTTQQNNINSVKDSAINNINSRYDVIKKELEGLGISDTANWQKSKLTDDNGFTRQIGSPDLSVTTLDNYFTKTEKVYVTTPVNSPNGNGISGFIDVTFRSGGYGILTFQPYNNNTIYMTRRVNNTTWTDWVVVNPDENVRKWIGTIGQEGNTYTDVLKLPPGKYECTIPADAISVNAPLDPNGGSYIAEIDVTYSSNNRKQFRLIANARNDEYRATVHTPDASNPDGVFKGWKKIQNEDQYNELNKDTGWIDWDTKNGATKRNTTDDTFIKNQYRIRTVNGTRIMHLRVNVNNITTQVAFGSIPAEYVPVEQHFVPRMPVSLHPGAMLVSKEGNIIFYQNTNDTSWLPGHYIIGEFTWIIDEVKGVK